MKYAIFGTSGGVGKELAKLLAAEKVEFRVVGRSEEKLRREFAEHEPYVEYCAADVEANAGKVRSPNAVVRPIRAVSRCY